MFSLTISLLRKLSQNKIHRILIDFFGFLNIQLFTIYNFYLIGLCIPIFFLLIINPCMILVIFHDNRISISRISFMS